MLSDKKVLVVGKPSVDSTPDSTLVQRGHLAYISCSKQLASCDIRMAEDGVRG